MPNAEVVPWRAGSPGLVPGGRWPSSTARRNRCRTRDQHRKLAWPVPYGRRPRGAHVFITDRKVAGPLRVTNGRVHGSGVRPDHRLCLAASATDVRHILRHRVSPLHDMDRGRPMASAPPDELGARGEVDWTSAIVDTAVRTRSIAAGQAANRTSCPMPRASHSAAPCPARTCSTASPASRSSSASPPSGPAEATETPPRQTPRGQAVLFHRTPGLTARAWDRRAHRAARHRLRRTPRPVPLEGRALRERNGCR